MTEYRGRGITPTAPNEHRLYGQAVHTGAEALASGKTFIQAITAAEEEIAIFDKILTPDGLNHYEELDALLFGHLKLYEQYILPSIQDRFNILAIEQELVIPLSDNLSYCTRLDKILEDKKTGLKYNLNYKTSQYLNDLQSEMETSMQLMMEAECARIHLGCHVTGTIIIGFDKGRYHPVSEKEKQMGLQGKRLLSPFTYLYMKGNPWEADSYSAEYKNGWKRVPTWIDPLSSEMVWDLLTPEQKRGLFTELTPIYHSPEMIDALKKQIIYREGYMGPYNGGITLVNPDEALQLMYPQNFHNCNMDAGYIHHPCPYKILCWENEDPEMLIGGMFEMREANHPVEEQLFVA